MIEVKPGYEILSEISDNGLKELQFIEVIGRVCYKSEDKITTDGESAKRFVRMLVKKGHEAMLEHSQLTVKFICDRGVSHELVRHRLFSFAQESTRYCNYYDDVAYIRPFWIKEDSNDYILWKNLCSEAEAHYRGLRNVGERPEQARSVLPSSLKTEVVVTGNYREWRNFFKLRTADGVHPQMLELTRPLLDELKVKLPIIFDDITY